MNSREQSMNSSSGLNMNEHAGDGCSNQTIRVLDTDGKQFQNDIREIESLQKYNSLMETKLLEETEKCASLETLLQLQDQEFSQFCENIEISKQEWQHENELLINRLKKENDFLKTSIKRLERPGTGSSLLKNNILDDTELKSKRQIDNEIDFKDDFVCVNEKSEDETCSVEKREDIAYKYICTEFDKKYDELDGKCMGLNEDLKTITERLMDLSTDVDVERPDAMLKPYEGITCTNASKRLTYTQPEVQGNELTITTYENRSNGKTDGAFEKLNVDNKTVKEKLDDAEHNLRVAQSKLDETREKYDELYGKYTCMKDNKVQLAEGFRRLKRKHQDDLSYVIETVFTRLDDKYDEFKTRWTCQGKEFEYITEQRIPDLPAGKFLDAESNWNEDKTGKNATERSVDTRRGVRESKSTTKYERLLNDKTNEIFENLYDEYTVVRETLDDTEHYLRVTRSKLDAQTRMNEKTSREYKILKDEHARAKECLEATVEKLKCTEQELQVTVLRLNEETCSKAEMSETNDRLEEECRCLRRNFRNTLGILHASEEKLRDTQSKLDRVVNKYLELEDKYLVESHSFERDHNDSDDTFRPIAEVADARAERDENGLPESQRMTDYKRLLKEKMVRQTGNKVTLEQYKILNDEGTCTKENLEAIVEKLKCTEQQLQETVLRLNEETCSNVEMSEKNDRLEDECGCLRRNFRSTLGILHASEEQLRDTRSDLDGVVNKYLELENKFIGESHSFVRDQNDEGDGCRPIAEMSDTQVERDENRLSEGDQRTDAERLSKENARLVCRTENKEMSDEYRWPNAEYTCTKENLKAMADKLKCTEEKLQETVLRLNEETSVRVETSKMNNRLEDQYETLRMNFKRTLRILHTSEQTLRDTRSELDGVVSKYRELEDKYLIESQSFARDHNDGDDTHRPIAEVADARAKRDENGLSEEDQRTDAERLSTENSRLTRRIEKYRKAISELLDRCEAEDDASESAGRAAETCGQQ